VPWEKQYDETAVMEQAMRAFWAHGYESTSVNDLVRVTGLNRGSLYAAFTDKRTLFLTVLRHYDKHRQAEFLDRLAALNAPKDAIMAAFEAAARPSTAGDDPSGCLAVNTALEVAPHDPEIRAFIQTAFARVEAFFFARIEAAKADGSIRQSVSAVETAQALLGLFLGLRVLARSGADAAALDAITSHARALLE